MQLHAKDDIKVFILYLMYNLCIPLEYVDINDVVVQDGVVTQIDFAECFAELVDAACVRQIESDGILYYEVTEKGIHVALGLQSDLLSEIKTRGLKNALRLLDYKDRGCRVETSYSVRGDGMYDLTCSIKGARQLSLEIKLVAENADQLSKMRKIFSERPEVVYRGVRAMLTGNIDYLLN